MKFTTRNILIFLLACSIFSVILVTIKKSDKNTQPPSLTNDAPIQQDTLRYPQPTPQELREKILSALPNDSTLSPELYEEAKNFDIVYVVQPRFVHNHIALCCDVIFNVGVYADSELMFLPSPEWRQHADLYANIRSVTNKTSLQTTENPLVFRLACAPRQTVHIRYNIVQDSLTCSQQGLESPFPAIVGLTYFYLEGASLFLVPTAALKEGGLGGMKVKVHWRQAGEEWQYANRFGANQKEQYLNVNLADFIRGVYCGGKRDGNIRISEYNLANKALYVVGVGEDFSKKIQATSRSASAVLKAVSEFWQDANSLPDLIFFSSTGAEPEQYAAYALPGCATFFLSWQINPESMDFKHVVAHECLHMWNSQKKVSLYQSSGFGYYFLEGFTDYFARRILLEANVISAEEYVRHYNRSIENYYLSDYRAASAQTLHLNFWTSLKIQKIPYWKGDILAHQWNAEILAKTGWRYSLSNVFKAVLLDSLPVTDTTFSRAMASYLGRSIQQDVEKYIIQGQAVEVSDEALLPLAKLERSWKMNAQSSAFLGVHRLPYYQVVGRER